MLRLYPMFPSDILLCLAFVVGMRDLCAVTFPQPDLLTAIHALKVSSLPFLTRTESKQQREQG